MALGLLGEGLVVLLDHYDNCVLGGTMDTTAVLAEILRQKLKNVAVFAIYNPKTMQHAIAAKINSEISLSINGKITMPTIPTTNPPLIITNTVKTISHDRYRNHNPITRNMQMDMGPTIILNTKPVEI